MELTVTDELSREIALIEAEILPAEIEDAETAATISEKAKRAKRIIKAVETARKSATEILDKQKKALILREREITASSTTFVARAKELLDSYNYRREQEREAERRRIEEAAAAERARIAAQLEEERKKSEDEELAAMFGAYTADEGAKSQDQQPAPVPQDPVSIDVSKLAKDDGVSVRKSWSFKVVNAGIVPREFLSVNMSAIRDYVNALRKSGKRIDDVAIPGVSVFETVSTVFR